MGCVGSWMTGGSACTSHGAVEVVDFSTFFDLDVDLLLDFFGSLGLQIFSTSAGRSSGGARATDAISAAVGFTSPHRNCFFGGIYAFGEFFRPNNGISSDAIFGSNSFTGSTCFLAVTILVTATFL